MFDTYELIDRRFRRCLSAGHSHSGSGSSGQIGRRSLV